MKATVAGSPGTLAALTEAVKALFGDGHEARTVDGRAWAELGYDVRRAQVDVLAAKVGKLIVIEVDIPAGGRGADLSAGRREVPGSAAEIDLTEEASETLEDWLSQGSGGGFDEESAAMDLAWALAEEEEPLDDDSPPSEEAEADEETEERWAKALLGQLLENGAIELARGASIDDEGLVSELAELLRDDEESLADAIAEHLLDTEVLAEVFVGAEELAPVLDAIRRG